VTSPARSSAAVVGIIETFGAAYISVPYKDAFAFLVLVAFWCSAAGHLRRNGSRRKHERAVRQHADRCARRALETAAAAASAVFIGSAIVVALAAPCVRRLHLNILIAGDDLCNRGVRPLVVLGLCGQINLAQAAFFGFAPMRSGSETTDFTPLLALPARRVRDLAAGRRSTGNVDAQTRRPLPCDGDDFVSADCHLIMINAIWLTHGPDGVPRIGRPDLFQSSQSYLAFCVAMPGAGRLFVCICRYAARARHARGTRQRTRGGRGRHRRVPHQGVCVCA